MQVLSVANHKGGVGKTATVRALGDVLSKNRRVLMIDLDPQSSLTASCGIQEADPNLTDVFGGAQPGSLPLAKVIKQISDNLYLAPSNLDMAAAELGITARMGREYILAKALEPIAKDYELVLIDCAPSLSLLVINALVASNAVLIPCQPLPQDVSALKLFLETVGTIEELNPKLSILGILPTFYDARLTAHQGALEAMSAAGWPVLPVQITRSVRVAEAAGFGESIFSYDKNNPTAAGYTELGRMVELWLSAT